MKESKRYFGLTDKQVELSRKLHGSNSFERPSRLKHMLKRLRRDKEPAEMVTVIRCEVPEEIAVEDIVAGDIVMLEVGMTVPADGDLLEAEDLVVDERALGGRAEVAKEAKVAIFTDNPSAGDLKPKAANYGLRGSRVLSGHAVMRVLAVGKSTRLYLHTY